MIYSLPEIMSKSKALTFIPVWKPSGTDFLECVATIDIEGVTIQNLQFRALTYLYGEVESLTISLIDHSLKQRSKSIYRAEWNPIRPHNNKNFGPEEFRLKPIFGSHHHPFDLNFMPELAKIRETNLPIAIPIVPNPKKYLDFLAFVGKDVNISNIDLLTIPPWERKLL